MPSDHAAKGKTKHFMYCPWTGLGLYNGFRGNRWLKNRIKVFKQFVLPSLRAQTCQDFTLWCSWRPEERFNGIVRDFVQELKAESFEVIHTYSGVCFYDDKYPLEEAKERLAKALHEASYELVNATEGEHGYEFVLMTIQPSDDCYRRDAVAKIQEAFQKNKDVWAFGFSQGYLMDYTDGRLAHWDPKTNPPFYTLKFPRPVFIEPLKHMHHTALKVDAGPYKAGTPLPSHEYVGDCLTYEITTERGFLVGCHTGNISTGFDNPFRGDWVGPTVLQEFGLQGVPLFKVPFSVRGAIFKALPYSVKRKLRYWAGEKRWLLRPVFAVVYNFLRA